MVTQNLERPVIQVMWHLNNECNLQCKHCYIQDQSCIPVDRLAFQLKIIERISELREYYMLIRVGLLGGEPLLDPNIFTLVEQLTAAGVERVDIGTNATLVDASCAEKLSNLNVKMAQISLEGHTAEINDKIRGSGSFEKSIRGLRYLQNSGVDVGIMTTISKFNLQYLEDIVNMSEREGAKLVAFNRMLPIGHGKNGSLSPLDGSEMKQMMSLIHLLNDTREIEVTSDDPLLYVPIDGREFSFNEIGGCGAGIGNLAICHDGDIFPCRRLPISIGNATDDSLVDIINSESVDCFYHRESFLKGECKNCDFRRICGGCRAAAYAYTGDHLNQDPQCWKTLPRGGKKDATRK